MMNPDCPFCEVDFSGRAIHHSVSWLVVENKTPYVGARLHLLFVLRRHLTNPNELTSEEWLELQQLTLWAKDHYGQGGGFLMRMGTFEETGSTIPHLHAHWILRFRGPGAQTVYAHFGPERFKP